MLRTFEDGETALTFIAQTPLYLRRGENRPFRLEYIEPSLAGFERKFVSINRTAIKREITKINKATKDACERIDRLMKEIEERTKRIQEGLDTDYILRQGQDDRYYSFLRHVQHIIGKRCLILKNESSDVIFKKEDRNYYYTVVFMNMILGSKLCFKELTLLLLKKLPTLVIVVLLSIKIVTIMLIP